MNLQVADIPFKELPKGLATSATEHFATLDPETVGAFQLQLLNAAIAGVPDAKGGQQKLQV